MKMACVRTARRLKKTVRFHLFLIVAVALCAVLFFLVPQVSHIWRSQIPPPNVDTVWVIAWMAFALFGVVDIVFVGVSVWVVPSRRTRDWSAWQRLLLPARLRGFLDWAARVMEWFVSRLTWLDDRLGSGFRFLIALTLMAFGAGSLTWGAKSDSSEWFLLAGAVCQNFGIWSVSTGAWFVIRGSSTVDPNAERGWSVFVISAGRLLAWLFVANVLGEIVWLLSCWDIVSFRAYALGAVLHLLALTLVFARTLDHLDRRTWFPVRLVAATLILIVANRYLRRGANSDLEVTPPKAVAGAPAAGAPSPGKAADGAPQPVPPAPASPAEVDWYDFMQDRLLSVPEGQPVLIVAASGGGSRAAIFTALALEFLARAPVNPSGASAPSLEEGNPARTWAQNIVLISSVSGGSLAVAHFAARGAARSEDISSLRYTIRDEMLADIIDEVKRLRDAPGPGRSGPEWDKLCQTVEKMADDFQSIRNRSKTPPQVSSGWMVGNRFVDDMCANFMAPILRGCISFNLYRGDALARFWTEMFAWQECDNLTGYGPDRTWQAAKTSCPAILYDACSGGKGSRLVVGFPPLPGNVFPIPSGLADGNQDPSVSVEKLTPSAPVDKLTRSPPVELVHLYARVPGSTFHPRISLAQAVRLSSNFPWGFFPSLIKDTTVSADPEPPETYVLDGGVVDNTGIDAIYDLLDGLRKTPRGETILRLLARRQLVILEIDSGAKPAGRSKLQRMFPSLLEPVQALNNSSYTNADRTKRFYLQSLTDLPSGVPCCPPDPTRPAKPAASGKPALSESDRDHSPGHVYTLSIECNHFSLGSPDKSEVMTAWALSPEEKASVVARFCYELPKLQADLNDVQKERPVIMERQQIADGLCPEVAAQRQVDAARVAKEHSLHIAGVTASRPATAEQLQHAADSLREAEKRVETVQGIFDFIDPNSPVLPPDVLIGAGADSKDVDMEADDDVDRRDRSPLRPIRVATPPAWQRHAQNELRDWRSEIDKGQKEIETKASQMDFQLSERPTPIEADAEMYSKMLIRGAASPDELREAFRESDKGIGAAQQSIDRRNRLSREWFDAGKWSEAK